MTNPGNKNFAALFKRYRLLAQFVSIPELADALAEKGYIFEVSIYYHWQKGRRIPTKRRLLICLLVIFIERLAIVSLSQANELLESAGQGYLTKNELHTNPQFSNLTN